jgi:hypothetical protein
MLLLLSVSLDLWAAAPLTGVAIKVSAGLFALTLAAFAAIHVAMGLVLQGKLGLVTASRYSYLISLWAASITLLIAVGVLFPLLVGLILMRMLGFYWPEFAYGLTGFCLFVSALGLFRVLSSNSALAMGQPPHVRGCLASPFSQPEFIVVLDRLSNSLRLQIPRHIVLGMDPDVFFTGQTVLLEGTPLEGGTLYLSLPLCRLLSEAEMTSLIAVQLLISRLVPTDWGAWLSRTQQRWAPIRKRFEEEGQIPAFRFTFAILWSWLDVWRDWQALPLLISLRHSAVVAGRENLACALTKMNVFGSRWPAFLANLQVALRNGSAAASQTNLSAAFADQIAALAPNLGQELVRAFELGGDELWAAPRLWIRTIGVDPTAVAARFVAPPADAAIAWFAGIEAIETNLSMSRIKSIFFLPNRVGETNPSAHEAI